MDNNSGTFLLLLNSYLNKSSIDISSDDTDWDRVFSLAISHNLLPVIVEGTYRLQACRYAEEDNIFASIVQIAANQITDQAKRTYCFLEIYNYLVQKGIYPLVLKGLVCRSLYPDPDHRCSGDEDIFIRKEDYQTAHTAFLEKGFSVAKKSIGYTPDNVQEITYESPDGILHIEVHFNPFGLSLRKEMNDYFQSSFERYIKLDIEGHDIYTLCHTDHFIFLFLHLYKHMLGYGVGVRQVIDLLLYVQTYYEYIDWDHVLEVVKEMKGVKLLESIFCIGRTELGFNFSLCIPFDEVHDTKDLLEDILEGGVFGRDGKSRMSAGAFTQMATGNIKYREKKGLYLIKALFPSYGYLRNGYPVLKKMPLLLPFVWVYRFFRYLKRNRKTDLTGSIKVSRRRIDLFKEYEIIR